MTVKEHAPPGLTLDQRGGSAGRLPVSLQNDLDVDELGGADVDLERFDGPEPVEALHHDPVAARRAEDDTARVRCRSGRLRARSLPGGGPIDARSSSAAAVQDGGGRDRGERRRDPAGIRASRAPGDHAHVASKIFRSASRGSGSTSML